MGEQFKVFTVNPGSTSTKVALFRGDEAVFSVNVAHAADDLAAFGEVREQYGYRRRTILEELGRSGVSLAGVSAVVGRCGGMGPLEGGTYEVNDLLVEQSLAGRVTRHPANLGAALARDFAAEHGARAFVVNPPDTDELDLVARVTGFRDVCRESKGHPLNQKEVAHRHAASLGRRYEDLNLVVCHAGGGVSVTAHRRGRMVDSTNCIDGDGALAPTRAGALPAVALLDLCCSGRFTKKALYDRITRDGGLVDHLGTSDLREVRRRIDAGSAYAKLVFDAMAYQIAKDVGAQAAVLEGEVDGILLTGGLANDAHLVEGVSRRVRFIAPMTVYAGEFELEAMAAGAVRVLAGLEEPKAYTGAPVWEGLDELRRADEPGGKGA